MEKEEFNRIVAKYNAGKANLDEVRFLEAYYEAFGVRPDFVENSDNIEANQFWNNMKSKIDQRIEDHQYQSGKNKFYRLWPRIAAAASILLILSIGGYFILHKNKHQQQIAKVQPHDIAPGHNQATLTLANGKKIILTKGLSGKLAQQGNTLIQVNSQDALAYTASIASDNTPVEYNTMSTAKGEQSPFPLVLADGTKVWLNAQSSITFPTAFQGNERVVKIKGEAYFEVVHNSAKPFKVQAGGQTIEDIGTHFNVNAYDDEPVMKTTLVEGSVKLSGIILEPNQQAILNNKTGQIHLEKDVNTHIITAWKDGYFRFDLETLPAIMREFARWYNVEVIYEGPPTDQQFNMKVSRKSNLSRALLILTKGGVNYRLEGRKLIVKP